jgi:hypothetical protein
MTTKNREEYILRMHKYKKTVTDQKLGFWMPNIRDASQPPRAFSFALFNASADEEVTYGWTYKYEP